jgi:hypothetical protein
VESDDVYRMQPSTGEICALAKDYEWPSAREHSGQTSDGGLLDLRAWKDGDALQAPVIYLPANGLHGAVPADEGHARQVSNFAASG